MPLWVLEQRGHSALPSNMTLQPIDYHLCAVGVSIVFSACSLVLSVMAQVVPLVRWILGTVMCCCLGLLCSRILWLFRVGADCRSTRKDTLLLYVCLRFCCNLGLIIWLLPCFHGAILYLLRPLLPPPLSSSHPQSSLPVIYVTWKRQSDAGRLDALSRWRMFVLSNP